jgi:hypothetical protein
MVYLFVDCTWNVEYFNDSCIRCPSFSGLMIKVFGDGGRGGGGGSPSVFFNFVTTNNEVIITHETI